jgi:hypothetical protein
MKKITIELVEDEKIGGYSIFSNDIFDNNELVIAEGEDVLDAIQNFWHTVMNIELNIKKNERNNK